MSMSYEQRVKSWFPEGREALIDERNRVLREVYQEKKDSDDRAGRIINQRVADMREAARGGGWLEPEAQVARRKANQLARRHVIKARMAAHRERKAAGGGDGDAVA